MEGFFKKTEDVLDQTLSFLLSPVMQLVVTGIVVFLSFGTDPKSENTIVATNI